MAEDLKTLTRILSGAAYDPEAVEKILPIVYKDLRRHAATFLKREHGGHSLVATELVHEAYMRLFEGEQPQYNDRRHFFSTASIAMRRILVEHARRKQAGKRIPEQAKVSLESASEESASSDVDILALDQALNALGEIDERMARVVELRYFGGLTETEVATVLEVSRPTVARLWRTARIWLRRKMGD